MADLMTKSADPTKRLFKFINAYDIGRNLKTWLTGYILSDEELVNKLGGVDQARIYARFISGGMMHVYNNWMADDIKAEPDVLARSLCDMLMGGLKGVMKE